MARFGHIRTSHDRMSAGNTLGDFSAATLVLEATSRHPAAACPGRPVANNKTSQGRLSAVNLAHTSLRLLPFGPVLYSRSAHGCVA